MYIRIPLEYDFDSTKETGGIFLHINKIKKPNPEDEYVILNLFNPDSNIQVNKNDLIKTVEYFQEREHVCEICLDILSDSGKNYGKKSVLFISINDLSKHNTLRLHIESNQRVIKINKLKLLKALQLL